MEWLFLIIIFTNISTLISHRPLSYIYFQYASGRFYFYRKKGNRTQELHVQHTNMLNRIQFCYVIEFNSIKNIFINNNKAIIILKCVRKHEKIYCRMGNYGLNFRRWCVTTPHQCSRKKQLLATKVIIFPFLFNEIYYIESEKIQFCL